MRIIGGENRGIKLAAPKGREVRPILGRVRESLFGVLRHEVPGARVADLFAGTGVIGLEALSRGAAGCLFLERDRACLATLRENARRTRREDQCRIVRADVFRSLDLLAGEGPFDLVFVDPPYRLLRGVRNAERVETLLAALGERGVLADDGVAVLRFPADVRVGGRLGPLAQFDRRRYGSMKIALFGRRAGMG